MTIDPNTANELGKLLDAEPIKGLLSPASYEIGGLLGDIANMTRFYATRNLEKIFTKWARSRSEETVIDAADFERVMPLLPAASMQGDDELQDRWAALLESAATADPDYLPSFGQTLSQLTAEEARFLDKLWDFVRQFRPDSLLIHDPPRAAQDSGQNRFVSAPTGMEPLEEIELISIFDPDIEIVVSAWRGRQFKNESSPRLPHARLAINDLMRLGIIERAPSVDPGSSYVLDQDTMKIQGETVLYFQYSLTQYGLSFISLVSKRTM